MKKLFLGAFGALAMMSGVAMSGCLDENVVMLDLSGATVEMVVANPVDVAPELTMAAIESDGGPTDSFFLVSSNDLALGDMIILTVMLGDDLRDLPVPDEMVMATAPNMGGSYGAGDDGGVLVSYMAGDGGTAIGPMVAREASYPGGAQLVSARYLVDEPAAAPTSGAMFSF